MFVLVALLRGNIVGIFATMESLRIYCGTEFENIGGVIREMHVR